MEEEPVFAFAKSFKLNASSNSSQSPSGSVMFTIAHIQDPVVQFASARGLTMMRPLWKSWFPSTEKLLAFHYLDYHNAFALASNYSSQLAEDAFKFGAEDYVEVAALTARQVMGATSFSGTPDKPYPLSQRNILEWQFPDYRRHISLVSLLLVHQSALASLSPRAYSRTYSQRAVPEQACTA